MLMNILQWKGINSRFLRIKADWNALNCTNIIDCTFLIKICKRYMTRLLINIDWFYWSRNLLN